MGRAVHPGTVSDRGSRGRRPAPVSGLWRAARDVPALLANGHQRFHLPAAQFSRSGGARARCPQRNLGGEPQSATGRCPHHGSTDRPGCSQSPLRAAASDGVRASRGLARGGGHLRRHCALSVAAHAGDRHSHGAGRGCAGGDPHHGLANAAVGWGRARCRRDRSAGDRAAFIPARDAARVDPAIALRCE